MGNNKGQASVFELADMAMELTFDIRRNFHTCLAGARFVQK
jgi:hypothetical protein